MNGIVLGQIKLNGSSPKKLKRLHRAFDPTCAYFLARALPDNRAGLPAGSLHHVAGMNWMAELLELVDPDTQQPPVYCAGFGDVELVARAGKAEK